MESFGRNEIINLFASIALLLAAARVLGEAFRRFRLPAVVGELLAGVLLGPTVFGRIFPGAFAALFADGSPSTIALDGFVLLGVTFLLLIAGLEVDLSSVGKLGRHVAFISVMTIALPFGIGVATASLFPTLFGMYRSDPVFSLFLGVALSITALPIIAKILMDINLLQSEIGVIILAAALVNDIAGWIVFSIIIQLMKTGSVGVAEVVRMIVLTALVTGFVLTAFRWLVNKIIPWVQANTEVPGGVLAFIVITGLLVSTLTEAIGIHAIFGAFLAGIAFGDSPHLKQHTREVIHQFINNIFAPLFFVSIGMKVDFAQHFNPLLTAVLIVIAFATKVAGAMLGGKWAGLRLRQATAIGWGMSARGAMEIILGLVAMQHGLISRDIFVSITIMAVVTSLLSAPLMKAFMRTTGARGILDLSDRRLFIGALKATSAREAISELAALAGERLGIDPNLIAETALERERIMSTGIGDGVAVPHARLAQIRAPRVAIGMSPNGIDFNAPDGKPARIVFLILTPENDQEAQIDVLSEIARLLGRAWTRDPVLRAHRYSEFVTAIKMARFGAKLSEG